MHAVIDQLLHLLQDHLPSEDDPARINQSHGSQQLLDPSSPWQCKAASLVCVLSETIFGASDAWVHPWHDPVGSSPAASQAPDAVAPSANDGHFSNGDVSHRRLDLTEELRPTGQKPTASTLKLDRGLVVMILEELAQPSIRSLVTYNEAATAASATPFTQQVLPCSTQCQMMLLARIRHTSFNGY